MARLSKLDIASRLGAGPRHTCPECSFPFFERSRARWLVLVFRYGELQDRLGEDEWLFCSRSCAERWASDARLKAEPPMEFSVFKAPAP